MVASICWLWQAGFAQRFEQFEDGKDRFAVDDDVGAVVIPNPNYFGLVEPVMELSQAVRDAGAIVVAVAAMA